MNLLIYLCDKYNIPKEGIVLYRNAQEIEDIYLFCKERKLHLYNTMFNRTPQEIEDIIKLANKRKIKLSGELFIRKSYETDKLNNDIEKVN